MAVYEYNSAFPESPAAGTTTVTFPPGMTRVVVDMGDDQYVLLAPPDGKILVPTTAFNAIVGLRGKLRDLGFTFTANT